MVDFLYNEAFFRMMRGELDLINDPLSIALLKDTYTPDKDNDAVWGDISSHELPLGGGYFLGGETLTSKTVTKDNTEDYGVFDAADVTGWNSASFSGARYAVIYVEHGTPSLAYLVFCIDLNYVRNAPMEFLWNTTGIFAIGRCA